MSVNFETIRDSAVSDMRTASETLNRALSAILNGNMYSTSNLRDVTNDLDEVIRLVAAAKSAIADAKYNLSR